MAGVGTYILGETAEESFYIGTTGQTFSRTASYIDKAAVTWSPTFSEIGTGFYKYTYTPTVSGSHSWVGTSTNGTPVTINFEVDESSLSSVTVVSAATSGALTLTRAELRARVARELGDYVLLTATDLGTTTTIIDTLNVGTFAENFNGRFLYFTSGTNVGLTRRVTATTDGSGTLTFTPAASGAVAESVTCEVYNKRGVGFTPDQYHSAINDAINDAYPLGVIRVRSTIGTAFDADTQTVTVPAAMTHVSDVEWQDSDTFWHSIPMASRRNEFGWIADPTAGEIRILGRIGSDIDGNTVRLTGYGRQGTLADDSDTCALNAEYIVCRAKFHLCMSALDRGPEWGQRAQVHLGESQRLRTRIRVLKPNAQVVRAA